MRSRSATAYLHCWALTSVIRVDWSTYPNQCFFKTSLSFCTAKEMSADGWKKCQTYMAPLILLIYWTDESRAEDECRVSGFSLRHLKGVCPSSRLRPTEQTHKICFHSSVNPTQAALNLTKPARSVLSAQLGFCFHS